MNTTLILLPFIGGVASVGLETCNYNDKNSCVGNWPCVWCNKTMISNITGCYKVPLCGLNQEIYDSCEYKDTSVYHMTCIISSTLFIVLVVLGYYVSMIVIFGTVNKLLINENVGNKTRKSINTILAIMTVVPLLLTFLFKPVTFYFLFWSYLITGCMVYSCIRVKQYRDPELPPYNEIDALPEETDTQPLMHPEIKK